METKTYRVRSLREAIDLIKDELGPGASILHSRRVTNRWWSMLGQGELLEVIASPDAEVPTRMTTAHQISDVDSIESDSTEQDAVPSLEETIGRPGFQEAIARPRGIADPIPHEPVNEETLEPTKSLERWLAQADFPADSIQSALDCRALDPTDNGDSTNQIGMSGGPMLRHDVVDFLASQIRIAGPLEVDHSCGRPLIAAIVGPTGVGKTTTLAKLAADFHLRQKKRVGLITIDTFRIAAVEQLRTYAKILDLPMEVVSNASQMRQACDRLQDMDVILIDTYGRSPKDEFHIDELRHILRAADPTEIVLVASCMSSASGFRRAVDSFVQVGASTLVISKIDEAEALGHLWTPLQQSKLPIRYVTTGQNVPDDIEVADAESLVNTILGLDTCTLPAERKEASYA